MSRVVVVPHDPGWAHAFAKASVEVAAAFASNLLEIHHIGSTSIPGIYAKPVIDMLAVVGDIEAVEKSNRQMQRLGYEPMGEFGIPGRRYFRHDNALGIRTHQVHAFQAGSTDVARHLAFRDFLRVHRELALQYSDLKRKLAGMHPNDIEAYMEGKDRFIKEVQAKALLWIGSAAGA